MELTMKQSLALSSLLLTAGLVSTTAQSAEFASADCVTGLNEIGLISVSNISGNPQDVRKRIRQRISVIPPSPAATAHPVPVLITASHHAYPASSGTRPGQQAVTHAATFPFRIPTGKSVE